MPPVDSVFRPFRPSDAERSDRAAGDRGRHRDKVRQAIRDNIADILAELEKPGRDPHPEFKTAAFMEGVERIADLKPGMQLEGVVTNVAAFGAFVTQNGQSFSASTIPLPTMLGGVSATVNGVPAGLFFVSTTQINLLIPSQTADGEATIVVTSSDGSTKSGTFTVVRSQPGIFTANSNLIVPAGQTTFDGLTYEQVSHRLNSPVGTTKSRIRRGLLHLKRCLDDEGGNAG